MLLAIALLYGWGVVAVVSHELAHAITARIVGGTIHHLQLGAGPDLFGFKLFSFRWIIRPLPWFGFVSASLHPGRNIRWRSIAFLAAGPLANALGFAIVAWFSVNFPSPSDTVAGLALGLGATVNAVFAVVSLIPRQVNIHSRSVPTDGLAIWNWITLPRQHLEASQRELDRARLHEEAWALFFEGRFAEARERFASDPVDDSTRDGSLAIADWPLEGPEAALSQFHAILEKVGEDKTLRAFALINMAFFTVETGRRELLTEAVNWSEEADATLPEDAVSLRVRGMALVASGEGSRGVELLRKSLRYEELPLFRSITWGSLALAALQSGKLRTARSRLRRSRRLWPAYPGLERIEDAIDRAGDRQLEEPL